MKFAGFRLPEGQIKDMEYIRSETGMSKSQLVRNGLSLVINDYFQKEQTKMNHLQERTGRTATIGGGGISLPDGW